MGRCTGKGERVREEAEKLEGIDMGRRGLVCAAERGAVGVRAGTTSIRGARRRLWAWGPSAHRRASIQAPLNMGHDGVSRIPWRGRPWRECRSHCLSTTFRPNTAAPDLCCRRRTRFSCGGRPIAFDALGLFPGRTSHVRGSEAFERPQRAGCNLCLSGPENTDGRRWPAWSTALTLLHDAGELGAWEIAVNRVLTRPRRRDATHDARA
ncbi:hypothetical protein FA95DRAFT_1128833 [Auriscalpium vulgare]|uniref:Uncharacterized protein n=1 Tax=Auriscalpium vulgare TaxID=40419 RepID=A0ACB8R540_9AGAM|nr:hypothetical protein FA95DRAFT_1128833 [Auriscalpium vulgare]